MKYFSIFVFMAVVFISGCQTTTHNAGQFHSFRLAASEADWIRNGEPIEFDGEKWYPADGTESLLDSEVYLTGEHRGVQFFVEKIDVRPYNRLYTKFSKNKFRYFTKKR